MFSNTLKSGTLELATCFISVYRPLWAESKFGATGNSPYRWLTDKGNSHVLVSVRVFCLLSSRLASARLAGVPFTYCSATNVHAAGSLAVMCSHMSTLLGKLAESISSVSVA